MPDPEIRGLKALSIRQPWAWAILHAGKDVENRDWSERYQGFRDAQAMFGRDFLIHASSGMTRAEYEDFVGAAPIPHDLRVPTMADLQKGGIVGIATLVGVAFAHPSPWFFGPVGLLLRNPRPLPFIPCKGMLGFFRPEIGDA